MLASRPGEADQVIIRNAWTWTIIDNMFGEWHTPCTLKTSVVLFRP